MPLLGERGQRPQVDRQPGDGRLGDASAHSAFVAHVLTGSFYRAEPQPKHL